MNLTLVRKMYCMKDFYLDEITFRLWCRGYWNERYSSCISDFKKIFRKMLSVGDLPHQKLFDLFGGERFEYSACPYCMISRNRHIQILQHLVEADPSLCGIPFLDGGRILNTFIDMG